MTLLIIPTIVKIWMAFFVIIVSLIILYKRRKPIEETDLLNDYTGMKIVPTDKEPKIREVISL